LLLDIDNRIDKTYVAKANDTLDNRPKCGIVYCRGDFLAMILEFGIYQNFLLEECLCPILYLMLDYLERKIGRAVGDMMNPLKVELKTGIFGSLYCH